MEEFQHLLDLTLIALVKESMYNATIGDGYRVGGIDGDNLFPVYSNPWYMRVMAATYVGNMMPDANMNFWGDKWAEAAFSEFDRFKTVSEFNSATYTGVTLYALSLWGYMPKRSVISSRAKDVITKTWETIGCLYNPSLKTLGGPWDRAYGFDMKSYFGILGAHITGLIGGLDNGSAPIPTPLVGTEHYADAAAIVLTTLVSRYHDPYVPGSVIAQLRKLEHGKMGSMCIAKATSPPFDEPENPRNYSTWNEDGMSIGGMEMDGGAVGGASWNQQQFIPAVVLWSVGKSRIGWIAHYATSSSISAVATNRTLAIAYKPAKSFPGNNMKGERAMTFLISGFQHVSLPKDFMANATAELPGLRIKATGNIIEGLFDTNGTAAAVRRTFEYGKGSWNNLLYYNLTFWIEEGLEVPRIMFE